MKIKKYVNINTYLHNKKHLLFRNDINSKIRNNLFKVINPSRVIKIVNVLKLNKFINKLSKSQKKKLQNTFNLSWDQVDFTRTRAFSMGVSGWGPIFFNIKGREEKGIIKKNDLNNFKERIFYELDNWKDNEQNKIIKKIHEPQKIYQGKYRTKAPDIILEPEEGFHFIIGSNFYSNNTITEPEYIKGSHSKNGILSIYDPEKKIKYKSNTILMMDILPTILNYYGINKPKSLDGISLNRSWEG